MKVARRLTLLLCLVLLTFLLAAPMASADGATWIVTTTDDHDDGICDGDCTFREALNAAAEGDTVRFDPAVFSPGTIEVDPGLGQLVVDKPAMTIDGSDCQVALSGAQLGAPTAVLFDEMSLTFGIGSTENQLLNAGFDAGASHWRLENPSCTLTSEPSSYDPASAPSLRWTIQDVSGSTSILYDASDTWVPAAWGAPFFPEASWIPLDGATSIRLRFQYSMTTPMAYAEAIFWLRFQNGTDTFYQPLYYIPLGDTTGWQAWDSGDLPMDPTAQGLALQITAAPASYASGLQVASSAITVQGLEIAGFPGHGIEVFGFSDDVTLVGNTITGNGGCGIRADLNTVAYLAVHDNTLMDNGQYGLEAAGQNYRPNSIEGNWIEGNGLGGIRLADGARGTNIRWQNTIVANQGWGIVVDGSTTIENLIQQNSIYQNSEGGILLLNGGNQDLPAPVIDWVDQTNWRAGGTATPGCEVAIYGGDDAQGEFFIGTTAADVDGNWTFQFSSPCELPIITAIASNAVGNSSPFSSPFLLVEWSCEQMVDLVDCSECEALVALYEATDGPNWGSPYVDVVGWLQSPLASDWTGIHVENGHVIDVWVQDLGLSGAVPWEAMAALTELRDFTAFGNDLSGTIEIAPGQWPNLEVLYLASNQLTGPIPAEMGNRPNMTSIQLYKNHLTGPIPDLSGLAQLNNLILFGNALSGQMPDYLNGLPNLNGVAVMWNALLGDTAAWQVPGMPGQYAYQAVPPTDVQALTVDLHSIALGWTPMPEPLPGNPPAPPAHYVVYLATDPAGPFEPWAQTEDQWVTGLTLYGLERDTTYYVQVRTAVPPHAMNENDLLSVPSETLVVQTPAEFDCAALLLETSECEALVDLYESTNGDNWGVSQDGDPSNDWLRSGDPNTWQGVTAADGHVTSLDLFGQGLVGPLPASIGDLAEIQELLLAFNALSGAIPPEIGQLSKAQTIWLGNNAFDGSIPNTLGGLDTIRELYLPECQLSGEIPTVADDGTPIWPQLGDTLTNLYLYNNQLEGAIPADLGSLSQVKELLLNGNQLSGAIPLELGNLTQLSYALDLSSNRLSGAVPASLGSLGSSAPDGTANLQVRLADNLLSGEVPAALLDAPWGSLDASGNLLSGALPDAAFSGNLQALNLSDNHLSGALPADWSLLAVWDLDLSSNHFSGPLPPVGGTRPLANLHLATNQIEGEIPTDIVGLVDLWPHFPWQAGLDLGHNRLTCSDSDVLWFLEEPQDPENPMIGGKDPDWAETQYPLLDPVGPDGEMPLGNGVWLRVGELTASGRTVVDTSPAPPEPVPTSAEFQGVYYDVSSTSEISFGQGVEIELPYKDVGLDPAFEQTLVVLHLGPSGWRPLPTQVRSDDNTVVASVESLGWFAVGPYTNTPPSNLAVSSANPVTSLDSPSSLLVQFQDPDTEDTHTITVDWGDGSQPTSVTLAGERSAEMTHAYSSVGVFSPAVEVTDAAGESVSAQYDYLVVYDPDGGFVTGGGWISSPPGAYTADASLTGKASFGFVSKYKKGAKLPTGETQFQFKAGDLDFHSESYDWLVVAGAKAKYKGVGTINGQGYYGFMISAIDAKLTPSTDADLFRIKIWDKTTDQVVYDNQIGADEGADPTTAIGGGSIVVHK